MADKISILRAKNVAPCGINLCESGSKSLHKPDLVRNHVFLAIVICTQTSIQTILKRLGKQTIHMSKIKSRKIQDDIISKLEFDRKGNIAFCIKINKNEIINQIQEMRKIKYKNISRGRITYKFHRILWRLILERIQSFLNIHGCTFDDVSFQCDGDCISFAKDTGLKHVDEDNAHMLSDIVAWANNHNQEPRGTIGLDFTNELETELRKSF